MRIVAFVFLLLCLGVPSRAGTAVRESAWEQRLDSRDEYARKTSDPIEPVNRGLFAVNQQLIRFVFRPLAKVTTTLLPRPVLSHLGNAFENLQAPIRVAGSLLQADFGRATKEIEKLAINSTIGIGGLFRPSDRFKSLTNIPEEDIGQAFGKWGIPSGPYLFLPLIGPTSARDLIGRTADAFTNPFNYWLVEREVWLAIRGAEVVIENPGRLKMYDLAVEGALDKYIVVREGYLDYRAEAVSR